MYLRNIDMIKINQTYSPTCMHFGCWRKPHCTKFVLVELFYDSTNFHNEFITLDIMPQI